MPSHARWMVPLAVVVAAAAAFVTCSREDGPPEPSRTEVAAKPERTSAPPAPQRPHAPRAPRAHRAAASPDPGRAATGDLDSELSGSSIDESDLDVRYVSPPPVPAQPEAGLGRLRVTLLQDGKPFAGGHICFYPAEKYVDARPWDGAAWRGDEARGVPLYTAFWPGFEPVLGSGDGAQHAEERQRGITDKDGVLTIDVPAGRDLVPYVRYASSGIPLLEQPRVRVAEGGEASLTLEAAPMRPLTGTCVDARGKPLAGIWVQAVSATAERPVSRAAETSAQGTFALEVWGAASAVRVRAIVPYGKRPLAMCGAEDEIAPVPAETTVAGAVPGGGSVVIRMPDAPHVTLEVAITDGALPPQQFAVEGLVYDARAGAWGRLGGVSYGRTEKTPAGNRYVLGLPAADAVRPILVSSPGLAPAVVDLRGAERASVEIPSTRRVTVHGRGWRPTDRLRVLYDLEGPGTRLRCIWSERPVGETDRWGLTDASPGAIEVHLFRDGELIGRTVIPADGRESAHVTLAVE